MSQILLDDLRTVSTTVPKWMSNASQQQVTEWKRLVAKAHQLLQSGRMDKETYQAKGRDLLRDFNNLEDRVRAKAKTQDHRAPAEPPAL